MFGGIPESLYTTYHEHLPKTEPREQYGLRQELYQLYHYLNHTVMFGVRVIFSCGLCAVDLNAPLKGAYAGSARQKMGRLLEEVSDK